MIYFSSVWTGYIGCSSTKKILDMLKMVEILICKKCGKEGVQHEFAKTRSKKTKKTGICKDCCYTKKMSTENRKEYFIKKELNFRKKIRAMYKEELPKFFLYAHKLTIDDCPARLPENILWVKCAYCGSHFIPTIDQVRNRINVLNGTSLGESRFYCSQGCRNACPIFNRKLYPAGFKKATSREVQAELRQMRLGIDNYQCQRCGKTIKQAELHCHHITGIEINPIESADIDNTITLCISCHKWVHTLKGCSYFDMRCKKESF